MIKTVVGYRRYVRAGVAYLDQKAGAGWQRRINVAELDVYHGTECVVGQLFGGRPGDFTEFVNREGLSDKDLHRYGFSLPEEGMTWEDKTLAYRLLTACWTEYLLGAWE